MWLRSCSTGRSAIGIVRDVTWTEDAGCTEGGRTLRRSLEPCAGGHAGGVAAWQTRSWGPLSAVHRCVDAVLVRYRDVAELLVVTHSVVIEAVIGHERVRDTAKWCRSATDDSGVALTFGRGKGAPQRTSGRDITCTWLNGTRDRPECSTGATGWPSPDACQAGPADGVWEKQVWNFALWSWAGRALPTT